MKLFAKPRFFRLADGHELFPPLEAFDRLRCADRPDSENTLPVRLVVVPPGNFVKDYRENDIRLLLPMTLSDGMMTAHESEHIRIPNVYSEFEMEDQLDKEARLKELKEKQDSVIKAVPRDVDIAENESAELLPEVAAMYREMEQEIAVLKTKVPETNISVPIDEMAVAAQRLQKLELEYEQTGDLTAKIERDAIRRRLDLADNEREEAARKQARLDLAQAQRDAETPEQWYAARVAVLLTCNLSRELAEERALIEMHKGCLGMKAGRTPS